MARLNVHGKDFEVVSEYEGGIYLLFVEDSVWYPRWYLYWSMTDSYVRFSSESEVCEYVFKVGLDLKPIKKEGEDNS